MEGPVEVAAEDRMEAVRSPNASGSFPPDEQLEDGASRAAEGANSNLTCSADPVRERERKSHQAQVLIILFTQVSLLKQCTVLAGLTEEKWTEVHHERISDFLEDKSAPLLLLYIDHATEELCLSTRVPPGELAQASYFVRAQKVPVSGDNFHRVLRMGMVHGSYITALLRVMQEVYAPNFFENSVWPDSILYIVSM